MSESLGGTGETGSGEKPPRGSRPSRTRGTNPRALGTNPRALAGRDQERARPPKRTVVKLWLTCPNCKGRSLEWVPWPTPPSHFTCSLCQKVIPWEAWFLTAYAPNGTSVPIDTHDIVLEFWEGLGRV